MQRDGYRFSFCGIAGDAGQGVIQVARLLIDVAGTQTEVDTRLLAFNIQRTGSRQGCGQRLGAAHAPQTRCQHPASAQATVIVLAPGFHKRFVSALNNALAADVDP